MRRNKYHVGRLRIRAADILNKHFPEWDVHPDDIVPASGRCRSDWRQDVYRWEIFTKTRTGLPVVCGSWDTLTRFVRLAGKYGCAVNNYSEIYALES